MKVFFAFILLSILGVSPVFAQVDTSDFNIRVFGAEDVDSPSVPSLLTATAVATSQIDIDWSVSVDNFMVGGYVVFRDGVPIATTTQTSYSDTSLLASTTYLYGVQAFDVSGNYSSTSNQLSATTFAIPPVVPEEESGGQGTVVRTVLDDLVISSGYATATFSIKTARPARVEIRWGRTTAYELGYIVNNRFTDEYQTTLTDLEPGTLYEYEVIGYTPFGVATTLKRGQFKTLSGQDFLPPVNVNRFMAVRDGTDAVLSWQLPPDKVVAYVRIVRSHLGFPSHPQDGAIVYQGEGEEYIDRDVLSRFSPAYYTAFAFDTAGNVSSGAVSRVFARTAAQEDPLNSTVDETGVDSPAEVDIKDPTIKMPDTAEIFLLQDNNKHSFFDTTIVLDSERTFMISIPKAAVADTLKSIIVSVSDPTDTRAQSSFLLRINKDKTAYEAVIAPLQLQGRSKIKVEIYDYEYMVVATYQKSVLFSSLDTLGRTDARGALWQDSMAAFLFLVILLALVSLLLIFFSRSRRHHEDKRW